MPLQGGTATVLNGAVILNGAVATQQTVFYDFKYTNTTGTAFNNVNLRLSLGTNIPYPYTGTLAVSTSLVTIGASGITWYSAPGQGVADTYNYVGSWVNIAANASVDITLLWTVTITPATPPATIYYIYSATGSAS